MTLLIAVFALLVAFQVKHFLCDYPLQGRYMLGKFSPVPRVWVPALLAHAGVHALGTAIIVSWAFFLSDRLHTNIEVWSWVVGAALFDLVVHFVMDRIKAGPKLLGRFSDKMAPAFWWCLGFDQAVHHLTHYAIILFVLTR